MSDEQRRELFAGSPQDPEDRDYLDNFEWSPELLLEYRNRAKALARRYSGRDHFVQSRPELDKAGAGDCDDCGITAVHRETLGKFQLCEPCADRRLRAGQEIGEKPALRGDGWHPTRDDPLFTWKEKAS